MPPQSQNCRTLWRQRRDLLNAGCRLEDMTIGHIVPTKQAFAEFLERAAKDRCPRNGAVARDLPDAPHHEQQISDPRQSGADALFGNSRTSRS